MNSSSPSVDFKANILDTSGPVVFFPVRHHSPACARLVRELAQAICPAAILIEGPADFNERIAELYLPHQLPIAIYSYVRMADDSRRGAFYPFCEYSPEWQALQIAGELGVPARFIDLPWAAILSRATRPEVAPAHRYSDGELQGSSYVATLCQKLGVDSLDTLWDTLFEIDQGLTVADFMERCHHFCFNIRTADRSGGRPPEDSEREAYMAAQVQQARQEFDGPLLVVTGGFHSHALYTRYLEFEAGKTEFAPPTDTAMERGLALTPYSYERLDSLTGYEAGMVHPGFYHQIWQDRQAGRDTSFSYRALVGEVVTLLRKRNQLVSAADLIALDVMAQGLATLRGHQQVWRNDLIDGITAALVKEELEVNLRHPFLEAVYEVLRGEARGHLAEGAELPPLVHDLRRLLKHYQLELERAERTIELELSARPFDLERSRILHRLRGLEIIGYDRTAGSDFAGREDLTRVWERWRIRWSPEFEAGCIQATLYGPTLDEALAARLTEKARLIERDAEKAALLLLDAGLMGLDRLLPEFIERLEILIRQDGDFLGVCAALRHLLYLYDYDAVLGTTGHPGIGLLLAEAFGRGLWLLESLGQVTGQDKSLVRGVKSLLETYERGKNRQQIASLLDRAYLVNVLRRSAADPGQTPVLRGAATGTLWILGEADFEEVTAQLRFFANPSQLGDYLTGLFYLAREVVQRQPQFLLSLDELLLGYSDDQFLEALPALRLAFSYFTPREKHYMARSLIETVGEKSLNSLLSALEVNVETATRALALETSLFKIIEHYGLKRGGKGER